ncbi:hypothetical protein [Ohtaekwangia sp.]|uniref:hypothetical protein n=1 Tax=Ohtaekwangia sp. TaxID=2066019 RepID=UPI002FDDA1B8
MKQLLGILLLLAGSLSLKAQSVDAPQKEFVMKSATNSVEVKAGNQVTLDLKVIRSKSFQRGEATLGIASQLPEGVRVSFDQHQDDVAAYAAVITTTPSAAAGTYTVVLNCTINHKTKGVVVKLHVL